MSKLSKAEAGFQCKPDTEYTCSDCIAFKSASPHSRPAGCALLGPGERVSGNSGGCNYFMHGEADSIPWMGVYTKTELGYVENKHGFGCKRCEYFDIQKSDCSEVERNTPGAAPGLILPTTCCNLWQGDEKRKKMTTPAVMAFIADSQSKLKSTTGDTNPKGFWS